MNFKLIFKKIWILFWLTLVSILSFWSLINSPIKNEYLLRESKTLINETPNDGSTKLMGKKWEDHYFAPFVDMASWASGYGQLSGVINISDMMDDDKASTQYYNLGFIQKVPGNDESYENTNGGMKWGWGGLPAYSPGSSDAHYLQIGTEIDEVRAKGGDVAVSFGGAVGTPLWVDGSSTVEGLTTTYENVISTYGLTRIDFDVEGSTESVGNVKNAQAVAALQKETNVKVDLTLPVTTGGLDGIGLQVLKDYHDNGVQIDKLNIMSMLFSRGLTTKEQIVGSVEGTKKQIMDVFSVDEDTAYGMIGLTNSIGKESYWQGGYSEFTASAAQEVFDYVVDKDLGMLSMWVLNRDSHEQGYGDPDTGHWGAGYDGEDWRYASIFGKFIDHDEGGGGADTDAPTVPANLMKDGDATQTTINVKWDPSTDETGGSGVKDYTVYIEDAATNGSLFSETFTTTDPKYQFTNLTASTKYNVKVLATDNAGNSSDYSSPVQFETIAKINHPPADITSITQKSGTEATDSLTVVWDSTTDPDGDNFVYKLNIDDGEELEYQITDPLSHTFGGLSENSTHTIKVYAVDDDGAKSGVTSVELTTKKQNQPPGEITTLEQKSGTESSNSLTLTWGAVTDPDGDPVHYMIQKDSDTAIDAGTSTEYTFSSLTENTDYSIKVWARDDSNLDGVSKTVVFTTESEVNLPPTNIEALHPKPGGTTSNSIAILWNQSTDPEGEEVHYVLTIDKPGSGEVQVPQPTGPAMVEYDFTGLEDSTNYNINVWAVDASGNESDHATISIKTKDGNRPPTDLTGLALDTKDSSSIVVKWNQSTDPDGTSVKYRIELDGTVVSESFEGLTYEFTDLNPSTSYNIKVTPKDYYDAEGGSQNIDVTTDDAPADNHPPTDVDINSFVQTEGTKESNSLTVQWNPSTDPDAGDTVKYIIKIDKGPDAGVEEKTSDTNFTFQNLDSNTDYSIEVCAVDNHNLRSVNATTKVFKTEEAINNPPTDIDSSSFIQTTGTESTDSLTVQWNPSTDSDPGDTVSYILTISGGTEQTTPDTNFTFSGLNENTDYSIEIWAVDNHGLKSINSVAKTFKTEAAINNPPSDVESSSFIQATGTESTNSLSLQWAPSTDPDGDNVSYVLKINGGTEQTTPNTNYKFTGLSPDTEYSIEIWAVDDQGKESINHTTKTFRTEKETVINNPPTDVESSSFIQTTGTESTNSLSLQWAPSTDPDGDSVSYVLKINGGTKQTTSNTNYKFTGLSSDTEYSIEIWAVDDKGKESINHTTKTFRTEKESPPAPPAPDIDEDSFKESGDKSENSITLEWAPQTLNGNDDITYILKINDGPDAGKEQRTNQTTYTFSNLDSGKTYSVEIWSVNADGVESKNHTVKTFSTKESLIPKNKNKLIDITIITASLILFLIVVVLLII